MKTAELDKLLEKMKQGERFALARVLSKLERKGQEGIYLTKKLYPQSGRAQIWGITGPPGAGKSTLVDGITDALRKKNLKVAILAVDPSSPFTGGAVLGDRIRMQKHTQDAGVYIRSLGTRGQHGGLSKCTPDIVMGLDAAGFDVILIETAGVGQTELEILKIAQTVLVVLVPESGDSIQVMKAGLMEIAHVFALNKSDRPEADRMLKELVSLVALSEENHVHDPVRNKKPFWKVPVVKTQAVSGAGIAELVEAVGAHQQFINHQGLLNEHRMQSLKAEIFEILSSDLAHSLERQFLTSSGQEIMQQLLQRQMDPYSAASLIKGG